MSVCSRMQAAMQQRLVLRLALPCNELSYFPSFALCCFAARLQRALPCSADSTAAASLCSRLAPSACAAVAPSQRSRTARGSPIML
jgi:hypothetical protein